MHNHSKFFRNLGIKLPYNPTNPLLGIYPDETTIEKDICTPVSISTTLTVAEIGRQARCSNIMEWIKNLGHIYWIGSYSFIKGAQLDDL